ncbi:MAG: hypothetical protein V2I36_07770 [Desulfopila sp.]|jgi:hypothetical protein|nr:hypothetical protein [Desulfopila sp.]
MHHDSHLLIVGGTGRNVGKTEFICRLIQRISANHKIYALKVSAVFPDEAVFHGSHSAEESRQSLFEETRRESRKDTSRMLRAGAARVFYLRGENSEIEAGFQQFSRQIDTPGAVICESNSLGAFIRPGLLIMVKTMREKIKPRAADRLKQADLIIVSDGRSGFAELEKIHYHPIRGWFLK